MHVESRSVHFEAEYSLVGEVEPKPKVSTGLVILPTNKLDPCEITPPVLSLLALSFHSAWFRMREQPIGNSQAKEHGTKVR